MTFDDWEQTVPEAIRNDPVWKVQAYRLSLFLSDLAWHDTGKLLKDNRTLGVCDQLYRAVGKISSNICEGYSRGTARARITFYEYALGSTRESRDWYYKGRHVLDGTVVTHRFDMTSAIIRLTLSMITDERRKARRAPKRPDANMQ
jgi:four helix bundle protein